VPKTSDTTGNIIVSRNALTIHQGNLFVDLPMKRPVPPGAITDQGYLQYVEFKNNLFDNDYALFVLPNN
jgi:hypothetical protein